MTPIRFYRDLNMLFFTLNWRTTISITPFLEVISYFLCEVLLVCVSAIFWTFCRLAP